MAYFRQMMSNFADFRLTVDGPTRTPFLSQHVLHIRAPTASVDRHHAGLPQQQRPHRGNIRHAGTRRIRREREKETPNCAASCCPSSDSLRKPAATPCALALANCYSAEAQLNVAHGRSQIVIGSGLGGLSAPGAMAKRGKRVLVLERLANFGGAATIYRHGSLTMEASLHETDGDTVFCRTAHLHGLAFSTRFNRSRQTSFMRCEAQSWRARCALHMGSTARGTPQPKRCRSPARN